MSGHGDTYDGPVCYLDGWHWSVVDDGAGGETPDRRLVLEDDGTYRYAVDGDESWHDRKHVAFAVITPEDGLPGLTVTAEEAGKVLELLRQIREEGQ